MNNTQIRVATGQGTLIATPCNDPNYPGIWLEIDRPEFGNSMAGGNQEQGGGGGRRVEG